MEETAGLEQPTFKLVTIEDYDRIKSLWHRAGLQSRLKGRDSFVMMQQQMEANPDLFIGAFSDDRMIGFVIGSFDGRLKGWINRLSVDPEYRRLGIAQELIARVEEALEKRGITLFCALIESSNIESLNLFRKIGYVPHDDILYVSRRKSQDI
ncbi:MAG: GNAT family N-acetyltransferase [Candidatus Bathyarchaeota archaeon]|nr:MAG: GNAT family N-acetyltransferase [Candidatus Bathyarchaeota archaeon]